MVQLHTPFSGDSPSNGSVIIKEDSMLLFEPKDNYFGADQFFVQANNSNGVPVIIKIGVQVLANNDIPVSAVPDLRIIVKEDSKIILNLELSMKRMTNWFGKPMTLMTQFLKWMNLIL